MDNNIIRNNNFKITLPLNVELTYKDICKLLGWVVSGGNAKKKQIKLLEECFKLYHPINEKTGKPSKKYVFTEQLKEIIIIDERVNNGGARENSGVKEDKERLKNFNVSEENQNKKGVYCIKDNDNNIYVGSTIAGFKHRYKQHFSSQDEHMLHTKELLDNGGLFFILWLADDSDSEYTIRHKELEYINKYKDDENYNLINRISRPTTCKLDKPKYNKLMVNEEDYDVALSLLLESGIDLKM